jgi:hypothetical protein
MTRRLYIILIVVSCVLFGGNPTASIAKNLSKLSWMPPQDKPGLYYKKKALQKSEFIFEKKPMQGLMIPAYYDGTYSIKGEPVILTGKESIVLFWVPQNSVTLGENVFASKGGVSLFKVGDNGVFARYDNGKSTGEKIQDLKIVSLRDEIKRAHGGLVQQKIQIFRLEANLSPGEYVLFQGGGNALDNEPHPEQELGCWYLKVIESE